MLLDEAKKDRDERMPQVFCVGVVDSQKLLEHRDDEFGEYSDEALVFFAEISAGIDQNGEAIDDEKLLDGAELQFGNLALVHDLGENLQGFIAKMRNMHDVPVVHLNHFFADQKIDIYPLGKDG